MKTRNQQKRISIAGLLVASLGGIICGISVRLYALIGEVLFIPAPAIFDFTIILVGGLTLIIIGTRIFLRND